MVFSSPRFIAFLIVTLAALALLRGPDSKKRFLAVASLFFYAAWDWRYVGLLLGISAIDYLAAERIFAATRQAVRSRWLWLSIAINLGVLAFFKYSNFLIDNTNWLLSGTSVRLPELEILLPAGISFYTFKTMSYTIDVYRRELSPCRSWLDYATFTSFFPELIAGPIVRASVFLPQLGRDIGPTLARLREGGSLFCLGLFKKLVIADRMSLIVDPVFNAPEVYSGTTLWCALIAYSLQIYCDFSGYSDMAVGVARMVGYDLPENFRMPYAARDISDFWRRWHMTLSLWLKDYLYIPLGGNRKGEWGTYRNLAITMLLGGLWHGASWNFVAWGALHGAALCIHRFHVRRRGNSAGLPDWLAWSLTLFFVTLAWLPFRASTFGQTTLCLSKMFGLATDPGVVFLPFWLPVCLLLVVLGHGIGLNLERQNPSWGTRLLSVLGLTQVQHPLSGRLIVLTRPTFCGGFAVTLFLLTIFLFAATNTNPFIYFQF